MSSVFYTTSKIEKGYTCHKATGRLSSVRRYGVIRGVMKIYIPINAKGQLMCFID